MEDILASIRRIIADDQSQIGRGGSGSRRLQASVAPAVEPETPALRNRTPYDDVLDLARLVPSAAATEAETIADDPAQGHAATAPIDYQDDHEIGEQHRDSADEVSAEPDHDGDAEAPVSALRARLPEPFARLAMPDGNAALHPSLSYDENDAAGEELLSAPLGASVMSAFETLAASVVLQNAPMLERVMREQLRPMLKTWLDDNLPALVERLVRTEIERVARGGRT